VAAFVTAKDPEIQRIAKNMAALSRREGAQAVSTELQLAMAQFALMQARGLAYVVDPSSAYSELSANPLAVDYVQFPRQTLQYQAGDCDDLSATYAALLQSVGVDTAFVTIPGHIYTAFRLEMSRREARTSFANIDDLIFRDDGTVWIPVETTLLEKSFMEAWAEGARQWREHNPDGNAGFYPTTDAWQTYEPVAFSVSDTAVPTPEQETVAALFTRELNRFVNRQIHSREQRLLARLEERPEDPRLLNRLGVLYARYGKTEEARKRFEAIVEHEPFAPAWVNLANIAFLNGEYREAGHYYTRALEENPYSEAALVGRARVAHRLENYEEAEERYEVLARLAPEVAERFSYLDPARADAQTRAGAAAQLSREVVWEEMEL
jgi:tetratricopeptide (TPR) repeat protein